MRDRRGNENGRMRWICIGIAILFLLRAGAMQFILELYSDKKNPDASSGEVHERIGLRGLSGVKREVVIDADVEEAVETEVEKAKQKKKKEVVDHDPLSSRTSAHQFPSLARKWRDGDKEPPVLCVVVTVFNLQNYIKHTLETISKQTYTDFEVIVINDGSDDAGKALIDKAAASDSRVLPVHHTTATLGGAGMPTNKGFELCRSKYVAIVDGDDVIRKDMFELMVAKAEDTQADVVLSNYCEFSFDPDTQKSKIKPSPDRERWEKFVVELKGRDNNKNSNDLSIFDPIDHPSVLQLTPVPWRKLYRRSFLEEHQLRFVEGDYFFEDNVFHWQVMSHARRVSLIDKQLAAHRKNRKGQTTESFHGPTDNPALAVMFQHMNTIGRYLTTTPQVQGKSAVFNEFLYWVERARWMPRAQHTKQMKSKFNSLYYTELLKWSKVHGADAVSPLYKKQLAYHKDYANHFDLTVVIPCYNQKDNILKILNALYNSRAGKLEVILVDDSSTDGLYEATAMYRERYSSFYLLQQKGKGAGRARNMAIPLVEGEYVFFLDSDDSLDVDALWAARDEAARKEVELMFVPYTLDMGTSKGSMFNADQRIFSDRLKAQSQSQSDLRASKVAAYGLINYPWNRLIKTSVLKEHLIFFGPTPVHNDVQYHWHTITAAGSLSFFPTAVCSHKKNPKMKQITNIIDKSRLAVVDAVLLTERVLERHGFYAGEHSQENSRIFLKFARHIFDWAKSLVPEDYICLYEFRYPAALRQIEGHGGSMPSVADEIQFQQSEPEKC